MDCAENDDQLEEQAVEKKKMIPRGYQNEMFQSVVEKNTILFLPTGAGKTFVSIMTMKHFAHKVEKPYLAGGKRMFFIAPKVALVLQQAKVIREQTNLATASYIGNDGVDNWSQQDWNAQFMKYQVLVMSAQVLLDCLDAGYISMDKICLIVFDECHHATEVHPMRMIMNHYNKTSQEEMPRILGLTAVLVKKNVKLERVEEEVRNLESNLHSTIAQLSSVEELQGLYADPRVHIFSCSPPEQVHCTATAFNILSEMQDLLAQLQQSDRKSTNFRPFHIDGFLMKNDNSVITELRKMTQDAMFHIKALHIYGGDIALLAHLVNLHRMLCSCSDTEMVTLIKACIDQLCRIRRLFSDEMKGYAVANQIQKFSSQRVIVLINIIKKHIKEMKQVDHNSIDTALAAIVFVERRITAKVLYHVLKNYKECDEELHYLRPDFAVGNNNASFNTRENVLDAKKNKQSLDMFSSGALNLLVASNVLEEGIDIPKCNLVVKFDSPSTFCSYMQSKGRARQQDATYYVLDVEDNASPKCERNKPLFEQIEHKLQMIQLDYENQENANPGLELEEYVTACAKTNPQSSVKILYRYCQSLPQDKFAKLEPMFYAKQISGTYNGAFIEGYKCTVDLPLNAKYRKPIVGEIKTSRKDARCSAAFEAVKILHKYRALDDHLKPAEREEDVNMLEDTTLFPNWRKEDPGVEKAKLLGTTKYKRTYDKYVPSFLQDCAPLVTSEEVYMHLVVMTPLYEKPPIEDIRRQTFYNLLEDQTESVCILTSKPWPKLCEFPIFMNVGKVSVRVEVNYRKLHVDIDLLRQLRKCHMSLLAQLLSLNKEFLITNFESGNSNYLVAPTIVSAKGAAELNLPLLREEANMTKRGAKLTGTEKSSDLILQVVNPWYRGYQTNRVASENKNYVITDVRYDMNPDTQFPSKVHETYRTYFDSKYNVRISQDNQPLIDVKAISNKINCLNPRGNLPGNKRRRQDLMDDFEEVLVPELCQLAVESTLLSAQLWLKVTTLPTILFRVQRLLIAEDLRQVISKGARLGVASLPAGLAWQPMTIKEGELPKEVPNKEIVLPKGYGPPKMKSFAPNIAQLHTPWSEKEPIDLDHNLTSISFLEVREYEEFASKKLVETSVTHASKNAPIYQVPNRQAAVKSIALLNPKSAELGPQQHMMYSALTTTHANDSLNMERLETLGDSYLKFATSLYLFCKFDRNEGLLTQIKGRLVGNRNLFYCGEKKSLGSILSFHSFYVNSDWKVPNLEVLQGFKEIIQSEQLCPSFLYKIQLSEREQLTGQLTNKSLDDIQDLFLDASSSENFKRNDQDMNSNEIFLDEQTVPDKCVSDCVEALLGAYVESCGPVRTARLLSWFGILPSDIETVMISPPPNAIISTDPSVNVTVELNRHLANASNLETILNYKFKDRGILLQALSHASFISNRLTGCFQRLEFLGDAVLDFLVTSHIYEQCGDLSPGQLTDLRSALVNNITFACLTVRYGFHTFMLHRSSTVIRLMNNFVQYQAENDHAITEEYLLLLQEDSAHVATCIEVPKVLGDIFESLAGAVFLDSGKDLKKTWEVFYPLMKKEIDLFSAKVPKSPIRMLYETFPDQVEFSSAAVINQNVVMRKLSMEYNKKSYTFYGVGENSKLAKTAAAKCALKVIKEEQS